MKSTSMRRPIPDELLDLVAGKFRLLADPTRLAILRALMESEKSVGQVVEETGRSQANVSKHLKLLADSGLIARRKAGLQVFYRMNDPLVEKLCKLVCDSILLATHAEADRSRKLLRRLGVGR
jgi:DNA-binding transcriptional ArsR family regulator